MSSAERFTALAVGILTIIGILWRIAYQIGSLVQRFDDHTAASARTHDDQEKRLRDLEQQRRRRT